MDCPRVGWGEMLGGKWGTLLTDALWALQEAGATGGDEFALSQRWHGITWRFELLTRLSPASSSQQSIQAWAHFFLGRLLHVKSRALRNVFKAGNSSFTSNAHIFKSTLVIHREAGL